MDNLSNILKVIFFKSGQDIFWGRKSQVMKSMFKSFFLHLSFQEGFEVVVRRFFVLLRNVFLGLKGHPNEMFIILPHVRMMRKVGLLIAFFIVLNSIFYPAQAQQLQANFHDWNVFKTNRGDQVVCYATSLPIKRNGSTKRGESYFLVTNIINDANEIGVSSGFYYDKDSDVELSFGSKKFYLFPFKALAWANDKNEDIDVIKEMQKSSDMIVSGIDREGRVVSDTYSLIGFAQSYEKMQEICKEVETKDEEVKEGV